MTVKKFEANTHYNDMTGTAAADAHDTRSIDKRFRAAGLVQAGEFVVGLQISASDVAGQPSVAVHAFLDQSTGHDNTAARVATGEPLKVRKVSLEMPIAEAFSYFKSFKISISSHGMIDGRDIDVTD